MAAKKLNILILAGGESTEREVSLNSARAITRSLADSGHLVRVIDTLNGRYLTDKKGDFVPEIVDDLSEKTMTANDSTGSAHNLPTKELIKVKQNGIDVVFNALHGGAGENGRIQALLDILKIPYTGSPMPASAIAMNKDISKRVMRSLGIPTADWLTFAHSLETSFDSITSEIENSTLTLPMIIKPTDGGSTVGLSLVEQPGQIPVAVKMAFDVSDSILVEQYMGGREITIAVLDGRPLPPVEIKPTHKLYDYICKYTKGKSQYICPAEIEKNIADKLADDAVRFYRTIGCKGYARVDFIVADDDDYICLELNTLPGMTELSLFPMAAREEGLEFDQLLEKLCYLALEGR